MYKVNCRCFTEAIFFKREDVDCAEVYVSNIVIHPRRILIKHTSQER